ncbi:glycosyltransferase [Lactobacillus sp. CBA3605]|uniref:glycosyltransferase family 2 protein n=1 Tax=Lactobacillus sp. CBA3605 TaxID=2099788 RepID=UPI000CFBA276|nr:glycosyltransferase family 2 protein [Lactobacillus sp. CBA3605]AVK61538.1 glycosyltransferase [Lactobacillus sp. CBA3605]
MNKLAIVVPAFNEAAVFPVSVKRLIRVLDDLTKQQQIAPDSELVFVDDGSSDQTWELVTAQHTKDSRVKGIKFSRNFGHQNALIAGMTTVVKTADMVVTIDADLQDDPNVIAEMVTKFNTGTDIIYGVRNNRDTDTWFKRNTAQFFYRSLNFLGVELVPNHADFRLMSKRAIMTFLQYHERNMFIRGVIPMLGFRTEKVYYKRAPRMAGESKYPLKKMLAFAWDGVTSFTIAPVRLILAIGLAAGLLGVFMLIYTFTVKWLGLAVHGWSSLMISIWILGGLQMVSLGIIGEYIGKLTAEAKHRPRYTIEMVLK